MVDAVGSVKQLVQVALKIKEAADTVRQNKEVCHQIRSRVHRLRAILSKLGDADTVKYPVTSGTLKDLEETLRRAYKLIAACKETNIVSLLFTARKLSKQLRQVNEDILAQMAVASFGSNVQTTIMLTKHFQDGAHLVPQEDREEVGISVLFQEDAEQVVGSSGSHSQHDRRLEVRDETDRVPAVEESSRIPMMPRASLPWFTIFTYSQLKHATNKFSCLLAEGAHGAVYKGTLPDGREVAVKRYDNSSKECYEIEVCLMAKLQHINIVKLLGCRTT